MSASKKLMPMVFVSHGTPMMAISDCESTSWWQKFGAEVLESDVKGILIINSHWAELDNKIRVGTNLNPVVDLGSLVPRERYDQFKPTISRDLAQRTISLLKSAGFDVDESSDSEWVDAPTTPSLWMFHTVTPPATTLSLNARYDPIFHVRMGQALRTLREEGILIMASGALVHNIFRANFLPVIHKKDNLQATTKPAKWVTDFEESLNDVITSTKGSELAGAIVRITESPLYLAAHPSNDHFYPLLVLAGALYDNEETYGRRMARTYEMKNLVNSQYMWGDFPKNEIKSSSRKVVPAV